jgi:hypothetical protein
MKDYARRLGDELKRQGTANKLYGMLRDRATELAKEQAEIILANRVKQKGPAFQKKLRKFLGSIPPPFMTRILRHYSKVFQREASKALVRK